MVLFGIQLEFGTEVDGVSSAPGKAKVGHFGLTVMIEYGLYSL